MQISGPAKSMSKALPVLAALVLITGLLILRDTPSTSPKVQGGGILRLRMQPDAPLVIRAIGAVDSCISPYIYTSLPPKCRTADGSFTPLDGAPTLLRVMPPVK